MATSQNIQKTPCAIRRIIQFQTAVLWSNIEIFDERGQDVTGSCMFSWSTDGCCWSSWISHTQYLRFKGILEGDFYLRVLISTGLSRVLLNGEITDCYRISLDTTSTFLYDMCSNPNLFQPYNNLDCALLLQQQMSDNVICMFGIPVYYLRVQPKDESVDYTFKEWVLHNVIDVKQISMMIRDGQMPSSNPKLTELDFEWENDWDVEISKRGFANAFGDKVFPKQRDIIYVPLMKRLWEVNSAYDEKNEGLLWRPTTWHLSLVKYNEKTNVDTGVYESIIDNWIVNKYDDTFGNKETLEQERISESPQVETPRFAATNLYNIFIEDAIRKEYTKDDIRIIDYQLCHYNNLTVKNIYNPLTSNATVIYQKGICGDEGTLMFIVKTPKYDNNLSLNEPVIIFGNLILNIKTCYGQADNIPGDSFGLEAFINTNSRIPDIRIIMEPENTYIIVLKWSKKLFVFDVSAYKHTHRDDVPVYSLKPEMWWFDFENPVYTKTIKYNDDLTSEVPLDCVIRPWPMGMTNIKYYNRYLSQEDCILEAVKYTTDDERCVFADLARPLLSGHGYAVR